MARARPDDPDRAARRRRDHTRDDRSRPGPRRGATPARGPRQADRGGEVCRRPRLPGRLVRGHDPIDRCARAVRRARPRPGLRLVEGRRGDRRRRPRRQRRQLDQGGPADPRPARRRDPAPCRAAGAPRRAGSRDPARRPPRRSRPDQSAPRGLRPRGVRSRVRRLRAGRRRPRRGLRRGRPHPRGRVSGRSPGAAVHREQRDDRGADRRRRRHRPRLAPVPVLRPRRAAPGPGDGRCAGACRPGRDRWRVRREGGVSVGHRAPRRAPRAQGGPSGPDDLRPSRGHRGDDEAAPGDRPPPHRRDPRRPADRPGHRGRHGRRGVLHADPGRPVARRDPCRWAVSLPERAHLGPRDADEHATERSLPRVRGAAGPVRGRDPSQPAGRDARDQPARDPPAQRLPRR